MLSGMYMGTSYTHSKETREALDKRKESKGPLGVEAPNSYSVGLMHSLLTLMIHNPVWDASLVFSLLWLFIPYPLLYPTFFSMMSC